MDTLQNFRQYATKKEKVTAAVGLGIIVLGGIVTAVLTRNSAFTGLAVATCLLIGICVLWYGKRIYDNRMSWVFSRRRLRFSIDAENIIHQEGRYFISEEELRFFLNELSETKQVQFSAKEMHMICSKLWSNMEQGVEYDQQEA